MSSLTLIVAATRTNGIGQHGSLPWRLPLELAYFSRVTKEAPSEKYNVVIMGRLTWESIPRSRRPLADRINLVITSNKDYDLGLGRSSLPSFVEPSLETAISRVTNLQFPRIHRCFIVGGASVYRQSLSLEKISPTSSMADRILLTRILSPAVENCDVFFPEIRDIPEWVQASHEELEAWVGFKVAEGVQEENGVRYEFQMWVRLHRTISS